MEYYVAIKKNTEDLYELIHTEFQNTLLNGKKKPKAQMLNPSCKKEKHIKNVCAHLCKRNTG